MTRRHSTQNLVLSLITHLALFVGAVGVGIRGTEVPSRMTTGDPIRIHLRAPLLRTTRTNVIHQTTSIRRPVKFTFVAPNQAAKPPETRVAAELSDLHLQAENVVLTAPGRLIAVARPAPLGSFAAATTSSTPTPAVNLCRSCGQVGLLPTTVTERPAQPRSYSKDGFGSVQTSTDPAPEPRTRSPKLEPVVIEYKPRPDYTLDARRNRIEGDVVLELLFLGVGTAQPVRIVRGLGFGLDESAWKASREIRFLPAKSDGKAVDQLTTVHFIFKLAY